MGLEPGLVSDMRDIYPAKERIGLPYTIFFCVIAHALHSLDPIFRSIHPPAHMRRRCFKI